MACEKTLYINEVISNSNAHSEYQQISVLYSLKYDLAAPSKIWLK